ncbi:hypothetical protein GCM10009000_053170 [Halobacterium noricense]|uniref:Uncharacterized protein n=1 Tax=Haladaptatus pallidirubidus TaxID=1008152 RepID=A0AAV3UCU2_9EURY
MRRDIGLFDRERMSGDVVGREPRLVTGQPRGKSPNEVREIRDEIHESVRDLFDEIESEQRD